MKKNLFLALLFLGLQARAQHLVPYHFKNAWGFADSMGKMVIPPFCQFPPQPFVFGLFSIFEDSNQMKGIIDLKGRVLIKNKRIESIAHYQIGKFIIVNQLSNNDIDHYTKYHIYNLKGQSLMRTEFTYYNLDAIKYKRVMLEQNDTTYCYQWLPATASFKLIKKHPLRYFSHYLYKQEKDSARMVGYVLQGRYFERPKMYYFFDLNGKLMSASERKLLEENDYKSTDDELTDVMMDPMGDPYYAPMSNAIESPDIQKKYPGAVLMGRQKTFFKAPQNGKYALYSIEEGIDVKPIGEAVYDEIDLCDYLHKNNVRLFGRSAFTSTQFVVRQNGKYGILSKDPYFNILVVYDSLLVGNYYHYVVKQNGQWFIINAHGDLISRKANGTLLREENALMEIDTSLVIVVKDGNQFHLCSNLPAFNALDADSLQIEIMLKLNKGGKHSVCFIHNREIYVLHGSYQVLRYQTIFIGNSLYFWVKTSDGKTGYVSQYGKEFFD